MVSRGDIGKWTTASAGGKAYTRSMNTTLLILGIIVVIAFFVVGVYNNLQALITQIEAAIQEIGNQLKRQASLIPQLESSVKAYLKQEKDIITLLADARKSVAGASAHPDAKSLEAAEAKLNELVPRLQVAVEDNPELKSNETVQQFMAELRDTADKLMYSRRAVIDLTQQYNQQLVTFPSNIIAGVFGFKKQAGLSTPMTGAHLQVSEDETKDVKVNL